MVIKRETIIPISNISMDGNEEQYVLDAVRSGWISSLGKYVNQFEDSFARYIGVSHAASVSNGTCALHLALAAVGVGPGDEVVVPSFTFASTVNAVIHAGATPVLIDSMSDHWNLDPAQLENAITSRTKAVIPVHLYGHPCDMEAIIAISRQHDLYVIEDAAEAHGAMCRGRKVGGIGHIGCFSFYGNKVITTGEGGMCVTSDPALNERMRKLRDHGMNKQKRYWHEDIGYNYRLTNLNAAIGVAQLERINELLARRAQIADIYEEGLLTVPGIKIISNSPWGNKIEWMFCLFVESSFPVSRDELLASLREYNVDGRPTFYPAHIMPPYQNCRRIGTLANAEWFGANGINLPTYPSLADSDAQYIVEVIRSIAQR